MKGKEDGGWRLEDEGRKRMKENQGDWEGRKKKEGGREEDMRQLLSCKRRKELEESRRRKRGRLAHRTVRVRVVLYSREGRVEETEPQRARKQREKKVG
eukprot:3658070-Rhodomonas_salina.1